LEELAGAEPGSEVVWPGVGGDAGVAEAEAVLAGGVEAEGGGAVGFASGGVGGGEKKTHSGIRRRGLEFSAWFCCLERFSTACHSKESL
jgi:hypothetical protein